MKKTLLLIGALAILSTTAMGVTEQWITDEITAGLEVNNIIRDLEKEEEKKEITKNKEDIKGIDGKVESNGQLIAGNKQRVDAVNTRINDAEGEIAKTNTKIEEHTLAINKKIDVTDSRIDSHSERINTAEGKIIKSNLAIKENNNAIEKNTQDLASHESEALARDQKIEGAISDLKVTGGKVKTAIEGLKKTDDKVNTAIEDLETTDGKVNTAIVNLEKTDDQMKENFKNIEAGLLIGHTRDGEPIYRTKKNEFRIEELEKNKVTKAEVKTVEDDVVKNTENIDKVEKDLYVTDDKGEVVVDGNGNKTTQLDEFRETSYEAITSMNEDINKNSKRITGLEKKVDGLETKMNKGLAMAAATSSIVYPHLGRGDVGIGAGMGGYGGSQAIAIGVAMQPTENVRINTNVSTSDSSDTMYGAGVGYKFNIFGS